MIFERTLEFFEELAIKMKKKKKKVKKIDKREWGK